MDYISIEELLENTSLDMPIPVKDKNYKIWLDKGGKIFPDTETIIYNKIPKGCYCIKLDRLEGKYFASKKELNSDKIVPINKHLDEIVNEIVNFKDSKEKYSNAELTFKRSYLFCGPPGTGKTSHINLVLKMVIDSDSDAFIVIVENIDDFYSAKDFIKSFRKIEKDRSIIMIIEDVDNFFHEGEVESELINTMDGSTQIENIVYLMTTNKIDAFPERMLRPSRIDEVIEILNPSKEDLINFFNTKIKDNDKLVNNLAEAASKNSFSMASAKELFISVCIKDKSIEDSVKRIKDVSGYLQKESYGNKSKKKSSSKFGELIPRLD